MSYILYIFTSDDNAMYYYVYDSVLDNEMPNLKEYSTSARYHIDRADSIYGTSSLSDETGCGGNLLEVKLYSFYMYLKNIATTACFIRGESSDETGCSGNLFEVKTILFALSIYMVSSTLLAFR